VRPLPGTLVRATNYFRTNDWPIHRSDGFPFVDDDRASVEAAWVAVLTQAFNTPSKVSVWRRPTLAGEWIQARLIGAPYDRDMDGRNPLMPLS
jgi:hypothetical protein